MGSTIPDLRNGQDKVALGETKIMNVKGEADPARLTFINEIFGREITFCDEYSRYVEIYDQETEDVKERLQEEIRTELVLQVVIKTLANNSKDTREKARKDLQRAQPYEVFAESSELEFLIDVAIRTWLMVNSRAKSVGDGSIPKQWKEGISLRGYIQKLIPMCEDPNTDRTQYRFKHPFMAVNLERFSGIEIQWTNYLEDHLLYSDRFKTLKIFPHKRWLRDILGKLESGEEPLPPYDSELIEETIKSLDLLFPKWDDRTTKFLDSEKQYIHLDGEPPYERFSKIHEFRYWNGRLLDLVTEFHSSPTRWGQIWRDRRNPIAFWTFWIGLCIALMTLLFGITASLLAGFALQAALHPPPPAAAGP